MKEMRDLVLSDRSKDPRETVSNVVARWRAWSRSFTRSGLHAFLGTILGTRSRTRPQTHIRGSGLRRSCGL